MQLSESVLIGIAAGILNAAIYALTSAGYQTQKDSMRPVAINSIKTWAALSVFSILVLFPFATSPLLVPIEITVLLAFSMIIGAVVADTIYLTGQERIGVSNSLPIAMTFPIFTYIFAVSFLEESLIVTRFIGVIIAVLGVGIISGKQNKGKDVKSGSRNVDIIGILCAMTTAILYAICTIMLQIGLTDVNPITANFIRIFSGSLTLIPMFAAARLNGMPNPPRKPVKVIAALGIFGVVPGSIAFLAAVKYAGAVITSVLASTTPLFALPISIFILKEKLTRLALMGIFATVIGVLLVVMV